MKKAYNKTFGAKGEKAAAKYLRRQGYKIVDRNVTMRHGEIDIIAKKDKYIVFVEVKTRTETPMLDVYRPASAVDREKRRHLISAVNEYQKKNGIKLLPRGDIIEVYVTRSDGIFKRDKYRVVHQIGTFGGKDKE